MVLNVDTAKIYIYIIFFFSVSPLFVMPDTDTVQCIASVGVIYTTLAPEDGQRIRVDGYIILYEFTVPRFNIVLAFPPVDSGRISITLKYTSRVLWTSSTTAVVCIAAPVGPQWLQNTLYGPPDRVTFARDT